MPSPRHAFVALAALAALLAAGVQAGRAAEGKKHPRLVSASANCSTCHGKLTEGKAVVHAATEDCASCHEVAISPEGTAIGLAASEPELCVNCHGELEKAASGELAVPHPAVADGCLTCHAPHAADEPKLLVARQAEVCSQCHDLADLAPKHGDLLTAATTCTACHAPHGGAVAKLLAGGVQHAPFEDATCNACHRPNFGERIRLQARGQRLCLACHEDPADAAGGAGGSVHAALQDGARGEASCLQCHNPHLSPNAKMLKRSGVDLCAGCHAPIVQAARAKTGHPAAAEDCQNCHLPHAAPQPKLLETPRAELCATCHDTGDAELRTKHLGADLDRADCLACHSPHGEGQPHLLAKNVHPPVLEGCDNCHEVSSNQFLEGGGQALCVQCHSEIPEDAAKAPVPHPAMEMDACTICHSPHATERAKLSKSPEQGCGECHTDKIAGEGEVQHGVIDLLGCQACHEPHGGTKPKLLRAEGAELCMACHGDSAVRTASGGTLRVFGGFDVPTAALAIVRGSINQVQDHPVSGHRALGQPSPEELKASGSTYTGELTCTTCHDPHKGKSKRLFQWGAASPSDACLHCHEK